MNEPRKKSNFAGDVLKLVSGTTVAQMLALLVAPILTRLFAPDTWGVLAIFASITGILGVIACLRYELAIMLPEKDEESANLLGVSLMFSFLISLLTVPIIWFGKDPILRWLNAPGLAPYLWLVPIAVFLHGVFLALNYWNSRTCNFGRLSIVRIISSVSTSLGKLGFGFAGYATAGTMIGATVAGTAISTTILGGQIWRDDRKIFLKSIRWRKMRQAIARYKKFPIFDSFSGLMNTVSVQLPPLLLAYFFSSTVVGLYALGHRLLSMPMSLIGSAFAQVFFQRAAEAKHAGTLPQVVRKTFVWLMALGSFPILLVMVIGEDLFAVVFGGRWAEAGVYAQILAPWLLFVFFGSPISTLFSVLEMQGTGLTFNIALLATRIAALVAGGMSGSIIMALILYSGTGTIMWLGLCVFLLRKSQVPIRLMLRDGMQSIIIVAAVLTPLVIMKRYGLNSFYIVIAGCLSGLINYAILYFRNPELQNMTGHFARRLLSRS